ncbi:MAG: glycosyltransferase [Alphaproteobacteria bacterium]|nr:glycosyltransferase [Alphaproteobacteria bacterium]
MQDIGFESADPTTVSVVIPVYAGEDYLDSLVDRLCSVRDFYARNGNPISLCEVVLVDDDAIDRSPELIDRLARRYDWIKVLHLARNSGQHAATVAGILHTSGDWVVTMDEDLQHRPELITDLLSLAILRHSDVIFAKPRSAVHQSLIRDWGSRLVKRAIESVSGIKEAHLFNSFRLIRGSLARAAAASCQHDCYFDVSLTWFTRRIDAIALDMKDERYIQTGQSGYSIGKLASHARRLLFSSHLRVLRLVTALGAIVVAASIIAGTSILILKFMNSPLIGAVGWTSLFLSVTFFGGVVVLLLGVMMEYLSRVFVHSSGQPLFFIADRSKDILLEKYFLLTARGVDQVVQDRVRPIVQSPEPGALMAAE